MLSNNNNTLSPGLELDNMTHILIQGEKFVSYSQQNNLVNTFISVTEVEDCDVRNKHRREILMEVVTDTRISTELENT